MGRHKKNLPMTKENKEVFLQHLREGMRRGAATDAVFNPGESNPDRRRLMREYIMEHEDFEKMVLDAEVEANEHVQEALYQAAISGSVPAAKAWIELTGAPRPTQAPKAVQSAPDAPQDPLQEPVKSRGGFDDLDNVAVLTPRQRRAQQDG